MSDKMYHNSAYGNFARPPCAQQSHNPYSVPVIANTSYNSSSHSTCDYMYAPQPTTHTQAAYTPTPFLSCSEQLDAMNWLPGDIERGLRCTDKMETIEITSKDLSPASCCSNIDLLIPDFYKGSSKDIGCYNRAPAGDSQWYCNLNCSMQRYSDYPSCSQMSASYNFMAIEENKSTKYFCMQKSNEFDNGTSVKAYSSTYIGQCMQQYGKSVEDTLYCQMQENQSFNITDLNHDNFYPQNEALPFPDINNMGQSAGDGSNDESDIIVEESEEEVTDYSEDLERRCDYASSCIVCNVLCTPAGAQFYILTTDTPLTMSSQQPVSKKLSEMVGPLQSNHNYLCAQCLSLINAIDHLQLKLDSSKVELYGKYEKTCKQNSLTFSAAQVPHSKHQKQNRRIRKFRNFCGLHSFTCRLCKKMFSINKLRQNHMMRHKTKNRFLCELCGQRFSKYSKFCIHRNSHRKLVTVKFPTVPAYVCKICNKTFRTKSNLKEHENFCSNKLPYRCDRSGCGKKFATITKLKDHARLKHDKKFVAICSICNVGFVKLSAYKSHKLTHSPEKKFNCTKCDKSYKTASNLNHHMKFHSDTLPFVCSICSRGFMRKEYLESHVNNHMGIKNFSCQVCDKKFVSQKNLDAHTKYHDGSIKKKICNVCNKCVTTGFEEHLRTHSNLREFDCGVCPMKFNTKGALAKHTKRKHANVNNET